MLSSDRMDDEAHGFAVADTAAYSEEAEKRHWVNLFELRDRTR